MIIAGFRTDMDAKDILRIIHEKGGEAAIVDASRVLGEDHIRSAMMHAERSFANGTNRSKTLLTEFLMYMAGERQISKALDAMSPHSDEVVVILTDGNGSILNDLEMKRDDSLIDATLEKAKALGFHQNGMDISPEDLALEMVAMLDILKN